MSLYHQFSNKKEYHLDMYIVLRVRITLNIYQKYLSILLTFEILLENFEKNVLVRKTFSSQKVSFTFLFVLKLVQFNGSLQLYLRTTYTR